MAVPRVHRFRRSDREPGPAGRSRPGRRLVRGLQALGVALALVAGAGATAAAAPEQAPQTAQQTAPQSAPHAGAHTVSYDGYSWMIDGKRTYLWAGEFHYFREPSQALWLDTLQKMKAAGFNAVSLYFDWGYHSPAPGVYDFTGVRDVDKLLDMADQLGIYVIARPGPYINAEVDGGGFPDWLSTKAGNTRTSDPAYLKYSDQWQTQIDRILARHQLTNGTGSVIEYQVENEYYNGSASGRTYMQHLEDKARADGITVPLVGNNNGTFNSGDAALDVDGADSYPQGFNCSNPASWSGVPDISYDHPAGKPLETAEFQGGAFDPWGGPGYDKCAQLINDQFADVFYKQNIAVGATSQSFYMTYGGTNWGWLGEPENYTSYDYGAAIRETRQLDPKYDQDKLIGYFTQAVAPLTKTDALPATPTDNAKIVDTARRNPDTGTQFHVLRHADSTATSTDSAHVTIDLGAHPGYTYDDRDSAITYTGNWSHVGSEQSYTGGDYQHTESFSNTAGDSASVDFTGTGVKWISNLDGNHGHADVYLDGTKAGTVDLYGATKQNQYVAYQAKGLANGPHTLKIVTTGQKDAAATDTFVTIDAIDVTDGSASTAPVYTVPQQPGTALTLNGRESAIITADYDLGGNQLQYSTSQIMTNATIAGRDIAVLYGDHGSDGETVLHYASKPTVTATGGDVTTTWDPATGDLRLDYQHTGLTRVQIDGGSHPLLLLLADTDTAKTFWRQDTSAGPVLVRGTHLLRGAVQNGRTLALTGDNGTDRGIEVFSAATSVTWNGKAVATHATATGSRTGTIPTAAPITLPQLTGWKHTEESPEAQPGFDDSGWQTADKMTSNSITTPVTLPVLFADDYGFHTGSTWYRGRFTGTGKETGITLTAQSGGGAPASSVWLNGTFLGSSTSDGQKTYTFPAGLVKNGADNVVSVLTVDMGHEEDYNASNGSKAARGLTGASLTGNPLNTVTWRLQGVRGGEDTVDTVRGPLNTGGLYGERAGYYLPGYPTAGWQPVTLPATDTTPGVSWYTTHAALHLPKGQDTSLGLTITDDPSRKYRAEIYVNGWDMGNYVNYRGPQHSFPVPDGILNPDGDNTIAIAVWNLDGSTGGLGKVELTNYGSWASSLTVPQNTSPRYDRATYAMPEAPGATTALSVPGSAQGGATFTATATVSVPAGKPTASDVTAKLAAPDGWTVGPVTPASVRRITPGTSATFHWTVTAPAKPAKATALTATASLVQTGRRTTAADERVVGEVPAPPPAGTDQVSDLEWLSASNGWGPVERDQSVGNTAANDGTPLKLDGTTYAKGLGTNSPSDVQIYLGGACSRFTATVGIDNGDPGSATFSVVLDGTALVTTPVLRGSSHSVSIDVPVTGGQVIDLNVGDGGDGNGNDHADWVNPTLTCG
ncbi:beta-galactosidase [Actinacidiphila guanduensis]|uniref:beta-galactosidase n=1 Tax=Actinacidiphila guanduensis TaxID=310781 RepID=A0A1H0LL05_9ACTN|nr:beta-galactosidase [Actinacidiphila guanduensis]SDO68765.1 NPCBM-associated, NEW3 domain of alpha-galactosidase [Actinacidiphila guanduensis]